MHDDEFEFEGKALFNSSCPWEENFFDTFETFSVFSILLRFFFFYETINAEINFVNSSGEKKMIV